MIIKGRVWKFGEDVNTDEIIPARYLNTSDPTELARYCMEDTDNREFKAARDAGEIQGDIIVGGPGFGSGSSREHAPIAIKHSGIVAVVSPSFPNIFYKNAVNIGLYPLVCQGAFEGCMQGDEIEIDTESALIRNLTGDGAYEGGVISQRVRDVIEAGGLMPYVKGMMAEGRE